MINRTHGRQTRKEFTASDLYEGSSRYRPKRIWYNFIWLAVLHLYFLDLQVPRLIAFRNIRCYRWRTAGSGLVGGGAIAAFVIVLALCLRGRQICCALHLACRVCPPHVGIFACMRDSLGSCQQRNGICSKTSQPQTSVFKLIAHQACRLRQAGWHVLRYTHSGWCNGLMPCGINSWLYSRAPSRPLSSLKESLSTLGQIELWLLPYNVYPTTRVHSGDLITLKEDRRPVHHKD